MKKIFFSTSILIVALYFIITRLAAQDASSAQTPTPSATYTSSTTKSTASGTLSQRQGGSMTTTQPRMMPTRTS